MNSEASDERFSVTPVVLARNALLAVVLILLPLEIWVPLADNGHPTVSLYYRWVTTLLPLDLVWLALTILSVPVVVRHFRSRPLPWGLILMTAFTAWALVSLAASPTALGATFVARWIGAVAIIAVIEDYSRPEFRSFVAAPLLISGTVQAVIALWQHPGPGQDFAYYGSQTVSRGTYTHQAGLALLVVLAIAVSVALLPRGRSRVLWFAGIGIMAAALASTLSRTGAVALLFIWGAYVWGVFQDRRTYLPALASSVIPFFVTVGFAWAGWFTRISEMSSGSANQRSSGRIELIREALSMIRDHPLFGVGPGGYIAELARLHPSWTGWQLMPAHVAPLVASAELGVVAGVIIVVTMVAYGWRALRTSPAALAVFLSIAIFLLLEQRTHYIPADVALFSVWLATLDRLSSPGFEADLEPSD